MSEEKRYTLAEIKAAFWAEFHKSGERWFSYFGEDNDETDNDESYTMSAWESFVDHLNGLRE